MDTDEKYAASMGLQPPHRETREEAHMRRLTARVAELEAALRVHVDHMNRLARSFQMLGTEEQRARLALAHFDMARCCEAIAEQALATLNATAG